jgi:hypothetical protein
MNPRELPVMLDGAAFHGSLPALTATSSPTFATVAPAWRRSPIRLSGDVGLLVDSQRLASARWSGRDCALRVLPSGPT